MNELEILIKEIQLIENKYLDKKQVLLRLYEIRKELLAQVTKN